MLRGSSTTWFQTSRYCRAKVEFNAINLVRHGSTATFETGLSFFLTQVDIQALCLQVVGSGKISEV